MKRVRISIPGADPLSLFAPTAEQLSALSPAEREALEPYCLDADGPTLYLTEPTWPALVAAVAAVTADTTKEDHEAWKDRKEFLGWFFRSIGQRAPEG